MNQQKFWRASRKWENVVRSVSGNNSNNNNIKFFEVSFSKRWRNLSKDFVIDGKWILIRLQNVKTLCRRRRRRRRWWLWLLSAESFFFSFCASDLSFVWAENKDFVEWIFLALRHFLIFQKIEKLKWNEDDDDDDLKEIQISCLKLDTLKWCR